MTHEPQWHKSSLSADSGNCVEVAHMPDGATAVRDSKRPDDAVLTFNPGEWAAFVEGCRHGEFDQA